MTVSPIPDLPEFTKADGIVYRLFGGEEALAIRRLADEMTLRHNEHHPVIRYAMAETAVLSMISYEPCTHGELMHAARLVSLSMLQTDLAHEAAQPTATVEQKVRLASEVMRLERTICQSEKHFTQRQAARKAAQPPRSPAATPAARAGNQTPPSTVIRDPAAEAPRTAATAPAPAAAPTSYAAHTSTSAPAAPNSAAAAAAPAAAAPVRAAQPVAASPSTAPAPAAPVRATQPAAGSLAAASPTASAPGVQTVAATPAAAARPVAAPAPAALASAAQSGVASAAAAAAAAALASPAEPSPGNARLTTPASAPHLPAAGAPRTAAAAHLRTAPSGPPSPRTGALLDLEDPPDGVSAAVRDELARAIALRMATGAAAPPPSLGFGQGPRP